MGTLKQLLPWGAKTVIEQCLSTFRGAELDPIVVVLGFGADEIQARLHPALDTDDVRVAINTRHEEGMLSSIQCGIRTAQEAGSKAILLGLVDQPFVPTTVLRSLIAAYRASDRPIVVPHVCGRRGHPIILSMDVAQQALGLDARSDGLRTLIREREADVLAVPLEAREILRDMDVPEDYRRERDAWLKSSGADTGTVAPGTAVR